MPMAFALRLEADDGTIRDVPVSFDLLALDADARVAAMARWDGVTPTHLAASLLFARTGLPEADWDAVGPVLQGLIEGDDAVEVITVGR